MHENSMLDVKSLMLKVKLSLSFEENMINLYNFFCNMINLII
jgi:hypothetical protein